MSLVGNLTQVTHTDLSLCSGPALSCIFSWGLPATISHGNMHDIKHLGVSDSRSLGKLYRPFMLNIVEVEVALGDNTTIHLFPWQPRSFTRVLHCLVQVRLTYISPAGVGVGACGGGVQTPVTGTGWSRLSRRSGHATCVGGNWLIVRLLDCHLT